MKLKASGYPLILSALILYFCLLCPFNIQAEELTCPQTFSLSEAINTALRENFEVKAGNAKLRASMAGNTMATSGFFPHVNLSEVFSRSNNPVYFFGMRLNQGKFLMSDMQIDRLNDPPTLNNFLTRLQIIQPIFNGGDVWVGHQQAKLMVESTREEKVQKEKAVILSVIEAYDGVLLAKAFSGVIRDAVKTAEKHVKIAEEMYQQGLVVKSDLLSARVYLLSLKDEEIKAKNMVAMARSALNDAIGFPLDWDYTLTGKMVGGPPPAFPLESFWNKALTGRNDLKSIKIKENVAHREITKTKLRFLPSLNLMGNWENYSEDFGRNGGEDWSLMVMANLNLFSGGYDKGKYDKAMADYEQLRFMRLRMESGIKLQVKQAYLKIKTAASQIRVAKTAVEQAKESLRIVKNRYKNRLTTMVDVLDREVALKSAEVRLTQSMYNYETGLARLKFAIGNLDKAFPEKRTLAE
jgi:outer membrane protein TolC